MLGRKCSVAKTEHLWQIYFSELVSLIPITYPPAVSSESPLRLVLTSIKKSVTKICFWSPNLYNSHLHILGF